MDLVAVLTGLLTQTTFGLPLLVLLGLSLLWLVASPRHYPPVAAPRPVWRSMPPDRVSTMYWALAGERLSQPIAYTYQRFAWVLRKRYGIPPWEIPWRESKARRLGIEDRKALTRLNSDLLKLYNQALDFEGVSSGSFFGNAVWERRRQAHLNQLERTLEALGQEIPGIWGGYA